MLMLLSLPEWTKLRRMHAELLLCDFWATVAKTARHEGCQGRAAAGRMCMCTVAQLSGHTIHAVPKGQRGDCVGPAAVVRAD